MITIKEAEFPDANDAYNKILEFVATNEEESEYTRNIIIKSLKLNDLYSAIMNKDVLIALDEDKIVGITWCIRSKDKYIIFSSGTDNEYKRQGITRLFEKERIKKAKNAGYMFMESNVLKSAVICLKRKDWEVIQKHTNKLGITTYLMRKRI